MKWVLIDLSFLAHRARHATGDLEFEDIPTGVLYGFFEQLYSICTNPPVSSNKILIFTDSRKSYRSRSYPKYKKKRKEQRTEKELEELKLMYKQVNKLKNKLLPKMGISVHRQVGLESDDLIAYVAQELTKRKEKGIIITSDYDLFQCITPYVTWYDPQRKLYMDEETFQEKYRLWPIQWGSVKALAGCASDCVPGLKGVGEKGAIKYLTRELKKTTKQYQTIIENTKEIIKWEQLVILSHKKTKPFDFHEPKYKSKVFFSFCKRHDINYSEPKRKKQWIKLFKGTFKNKTRRRKRGKRKRKLI